MSRTQSDAILRHVRRVAADREDSTLTDRDLLRRFAVRRDEAAFTALVGRHGPMVLEVGLRVLHHRHDAEDVLQATFLVLARKAGAPVWQASVGHWLHEVAYRLARKAKADGARRAARLARLPGRPACEPGPEDLGWHAVLDEELRRLPAKYRAALVLCYLEGATRDEAARQLACPLGTLKSRLERGRELLRARLTRRGVTLSGALLAAGLAGQTAGASAARLVTAVSRAALHAAGDAPAAGVSPAAAALARAALRYSRLRIAAAVLLTLGALAAGAAPLARRALAPAAEGEPPPAPSATSPAAAEGGPRARADRQGDPLPEEAVARLGTLRFRHGAHLQSLAFLPDGQRLIGQGGDGVRVWDVATGRQLGRVPGGGTGALSPDGKWVAVMDGGTKGWIALREVATGKLVRRFGDRPVARLLFSPDAKVLAALRSAGGIDLWSPTTGALLRALGGHKDQVWSAVFSADGKTLVSGGDDRTVRFWDVATGKEVRQVACGEGVNQVALSPDGRLLATVGHVKYAEGNMSFWVAANRVRVWDARTGKELHSLALPAVEVRPGVPAGVLAMSFAPAGNTLVTGGFDGVHRVWDAATGKERRQFGGFAGGPSGFAFSPDGKSLALSDGGSTIRVIDLASGKDRLPLDGHRTSVNSVLVTPDGRAVTAGWDGAVYFWESATGRLLRHRPGPIGAVTGVEFLPGGKSYLAQGADKVLRAFDLETGKEVRPFPWNERGRDFALSPDGRTCAEVTADKKGVRLLDAATGAALHTLKGAEPFAGGLAFAPDGRTLFTWAGDSSVTVWDVASGRKARQFAGPAAPRDPAALPYFTVRLSPDGKLLAFCLQEPVLPILDVATGREVRRFAVAPDGVSALAFSPDGKSVAWGGWRDGTVYLGELATGRERHRFVGHRGRVLALAFSPDGTTLVSGTQDTTALVWDLTGRRAGGVKEGPLSPADLAAHWAALSDPDAARGFRAVRALAADPARSVPLLGERLRPVAAVGEKRLARLLADLGSDEFAVREGAEAELGKLGESALPAVRSALAGGPVLDVRRRLERLVEKPEREEWSPSPGRLRALRAVEALEWAGTQEARRVLDGLAGGAPGARLTREVRAARERLSARPADRRGAGGTSP